MPPGFLLISRCPSLPLVLPSFSVCPITHPARIVTYKQHGIRARKSDNSPLQGMLHIVPQIHEPAPAQERNRRSLLALLLLPMELVSAWSWVGYYLASGVRARAPSGGRGGGGEEGFTVEIDRYRKRAAGTIDEGRRGKRDLRVLALISVSGELWRRRHRPVANYGASVHPFSLLLFRIDARSVFFPSSPSFALLIPRDPTVCPNAFL